MKLQLRMCFIIYYTVCVILYYMCDTTILYVLYYIKCLTLILKDLHFSFVLRYRKFHSYKMIHKYVVLIQENVVNLLEQ